MPWASTGSLYVNAYSMRMQNAMGEHMPFVCDRMQHTDAKALWASTASLCVVIYNVRMQDPMVDCHGIPEEASAVVMHSGMAHHYSAYTSGVVVGYARVHHNS